MFIRLPREVGKERKLIHTIEDLINYINRNNGYTEVWVSLYSFAETTLKRGIYDTAIVDKIYFDIDGQDAYEQLQQWNDMFKDYKRVINMSGGYFNTYLFPKYFDANKQTLYNYHKEVFKDLDVVCKDPTFWGNLSKMVRVHGTYNVRRGRYCTSLTEKEISMKKEDIIEMAKKQRLKFNIINKGGKLVNLDPYKERMFVSKHPTLYDHLEPDIIPVEGIEVKTIENGMIIPCLLNGNTVANPTHDMRYYLVAYLSDLLREGETVDSNTLKNIKKEIYNFIHNLKWRDFDSKYTYQQVSNICNNYQSGINCQTLIDKGYCPGKCWRYS